jgi:hypothetical protein
MGVAVVLAVGMAGAAMARPTDSVLHAAYCFWVFDVSQKQFQAKNAGSPLDRELLAKVIELKRRFWRYLLATGALTDPDAALGLLLAKRQAESDQTEMDRMMRTCPKLGPPLSPETEAFLQCMEEDAAVQRMRACQKPDGLPF